MHRWTAEADICVAPSTDSRTGTSSSPSHKPQHHHDTDRYGLHNFIVLHSLLQRHLSTGRVGGK